jgi:hypothetical protein
MGLDQDIEMKRMVMKAFGRSNALHWMNGRSLARHEKGTHGNGSPNDGFNNADHHDGENNADQDDGEDNVDMDDEVLNKWDVEQEAKYEKTMAEMF